MMQSGEKRALGRTPDRAVLACARDGPLRRGTGAFASGWRSSMVVGQDDASFGGRGKGASRA
jgi:hypothetical protein